MGPERVVTMTGLLPPVGWGDLATKSDLKTEFGLLRAEMQAAHSEQCLKLFFGMVVSNAMLVGLVLAAVRFG